MSEGGGDAFNFMNEAFISLKAKKARQTTKDQPPI
jgi:hypothetical protein